MNSEEQMHTHICQDASATDGDIYLHRAADHR